MIREWLKDLATRSLESGCETASVSGKRMLVVAPHYDDEVLGCGGTIARHRANGGEVHLLFMTDGSASHRHLMPSAELSQRRRAESELAGRHLSVSADNRIHLSLPDGELENQLPGATASALEAISAIAPELVLVPWRHDSPGDHTATHQVVASALNGLTGDVEVWEYAVWAWHPWPWCPLAFGSRREIPGHWLADVSLSLKLLRSLNVKVPIQEYLPVKRNALAAYASQTQRLVDDERWKVLADVAAGEWVENCFQRYEYFARVT